MDASALKALVDKIATAVQGGKVEVREELAQACTSKLTPPGGPVYGHRTQSSCLPSCRALLRQTRMRCGCVGLLDGPQPAQSARS